jgi:SAM-dependent methyltransferase
MSIELQHQKQADAWTADRDAPDRAETLESWFREDTVDHWRHARMYEPVRAFSHDPDARWLTVGDGRFGLDSIRIRRLGFTSVLPTDIGDGLLEQSFRRGLITEYRVENAERMSLADNSFDVVFCKESYHHFPRGPLALYEMLRVAQHAVILVEPRDYCIDRPANRSIGPLGFCRGLLTWALQRAGIGRKPLSLKERHQLGDVPAYESVGNYVYTISSRELEKTALGMNLPAVALKGLNDHYEKGVETTLAERESELFQKLQRNIANGDRLSKSGIGSTSMLMAIMFKSLPDVRTRQFLVDNDWLILDLPRNPYL